MSVLVAILVLTGSYADPIQGKRSEAERAAVKARLDEISESRRPGREKLAIAEKLFLEGKFKAAKTHCDADLFPIF